KSEYLSSLADFTRLNLPVLAFGSTELSACDNQRAECGINHKNLKVSALRSPTTHARIPACL
ncbi:hypothetical protein, partial [Funiculus sociatus]|uniref:hypothetical protein n=1 Tax=Funiculus sociatus TaxID=450527 RepID=UPI0032999455